METTNDQKIIHSSLVKQLIYLLCLAPLFLSYSGYSQINPLVSIQNGQIKGYTNSSGDIRIFKGIPFAQPPVGDLRWKAPQPVKNWDGIIDCTDFGPSPMQAAPAPFMFWSSEFLIPEKPISEDCLYLNVWSGAKDPSEKRPVIVYIYGGGFRSGGSGCPIYDGEAMAKKGIVFVSINYRVGVFGFLAHPELTQETEYKSSGNYALLDMVAALHWVRKNIQAFGGDPENVTIAGQSAGAFAVNFLTASPLAKGLFHRAIAESGASFVSSPLRTEISIRNAETQGAAYAQSLNCNSIKELRSKTADEILQMQGGLSSPIIDGYVLPESIYNTYQKGNQNDVPVLAGWNKEDIVFMRPTSAESFREQMQKRLGEYSNDFFSVYPSGTEEESTQSQSELSRDESFAFQMYTWAKMQSNTGKSNVYLYNFDRALPAYGPETQFGAFHSSEIVYAYNNLNTLDRPWEESDYQIADTMSSYWVNFANSGDPNGPDLPKWPSFEPAEEMVMIIDEKTESKVLPSIDQMHFWEKYYFRK